MRNQPSSSSSGYFDPEYNSDHKIRNTRMNPPSIVVDDFTCESATLIKVTSANTDGVLLEVIQVLMDLNLCISKVYISSDGGWVMDVFHVTDQEGKKVMDKPIIENIKRCLGAVEHDAKHTAIEINGMDRPGLLSEISTVLTNLKCNISDAEVWTCNTRVACVVYITGDSTEDAVDDLERLLQIREQLCDLIGREGDDHHEQGARISFENINMERRLHQMMSSYGEERSENRNSEGGRPVVTITTCKEKGYSFVNVQSRDRPKLLFDTVVALTDMKQVVYHGTANSENGYARQEYYIRDEHGGLLESEAEKQQVIQGLEAAIERRVSDGVRLEFLAKDKIGLLSEFTRMLHKNGLSVTSANIETRGNEAVDVFYVTGVKGNSVDPSTLEFILKTMNTQSSKLKVKHIPRLPHSPPKELAKESEGFCFGRIIRSVFAKFLVDLARLLCWAGFE